MRAVRPEPEVIPPGPPLWEQVAAGFVVCMLTGALIGPVLAPDQGETPLLRLFWLPVYAIVAGLVLLRFKTIARAWPAVLAWACIVSLAFASKYWSIDPSMTGRRVIAMVISGSFAMYLGTSFHGHCLPRLLTHCAFIMGLLSILMVFAVPSIGVHQDVNAGMWRGIWYEKNQMGMVMAAGGTAAAAWAASEDRRWKTPLLTILLCILLVLAARSKTSLLCIMLGVGMVGALWTLKRGGPALAVAAVWMGVVGGAAGWWLWTYESAEILAALGKDPSLTGRTGIWDALFVKIAERPWTGYGYNAFWGLDSEPALWVRYQTGWVVPSAHNGWIDLLVQLGWPGAVLVGTIMTSSYVLTLLRLPTAGLREGFWGIAYLSVYILLTFSESVLLSAQSLPWTLCLAILARAVYPEPPFDRVTLAPKRRGAYQSGPRITADCVDGRPILHARRR
ncbi:O-antigen ligase family protein [Brevundimonas bullata]|uniref:O-antigen ligase family protein n=1 Tax=Brevundimonas bullata TaxID=13160 RepID=UPI001FE28467|nr:O-antigen ligase family protein [Brevundimonas bullata]WQE38131.1 O-antigen ligase family protein [Brevundimonas bullata]